MNVRAVAIMSAAGLAGGAEAQTSASLDLKVSLDGISWLDHVDARPGMRVHAAMFIGWMGDGVGLAGAVYQIAGGGGSFDDAIDISSPGLGRQATFNFGSATQAVFGDARSFRIDDARDDANERRLGIATAQNNPQVLLDQFRVENPAFVYAFDIVLAADGAVRTIRLDAPLDQLKGPPTDSTHGVVGVYSDRSATRGTNTADVTTDSASITVVPAPGALAVVWVAGVAARRRR